MIRILLADDHPSTRSGIAAWLRDEEGLELAGVAEDGESAWRGVQELRPDLALLDIEMPNGGGLEIASRIARSGLPTRVLMLTAYSAQQYVMAAIRAGARGFVLKSAPFDLLRRAIFEASQGGFFLDPSLSLDAPDEGPELTERELEVLLLTARGLPSSEAARLLFITRRTVAAHLTSIYGKLGARNKTEAVLAALKRGIIMLDQIGEVGGDSD